MPMGLGRPKSEATNVALLFCQASQGAKQRRASFDYTSGLDYDSMMSVCDLIISVTGRENASIVITHDYEFILSACNRVVLLEDGIITEDFPLDNPERLEKIFQNHL